MSEGRTKVTKEVLCEESRFILANVMAEGRYGRQNSYDDIRRVCEGAITIPFSEYISFLDAAGYLRHDRATESLEVTADGEGIVNGGKLDELTERAVAHFKQARRRKDEAPRERPSDRYQVSSTKGRSSPAVADRPSMVSRTPAPPPAAPPPAAPPPAAPLPASLPSGVVGGEIQSSSEVLDSRYEKLSAIGTGGIGTVYRARQVPLDREVALKEIRELFSYFGPEQRPELVRRFTDVVRAAAQLAHPNIMPIHEVNLEREHPYVVSELAPNGSCRRLIEDAESIPVELALRYLLQTLHALQAAHSLRIYHRGLKPENLLIDAYGNVKVSDFGFARIVERDAAVIQQVYVGMGNIAYMAPELYNEPVAAGPQTDIYALGIIFYELLTRRLPGRRSPMPSQINSALPPGIDDVFDRMTRDSRAERYSKVSDILSDLDRLDGLGEFLDRQTQVLTPDNPLDAITFRQSSHEQPTAGDQASVGDQTSVHLEAAPPAEPAEATAPSGDDKSKSTSYRPYSYQQRRKR